MSDENKRVPQQPPQQPPERQDIPQNDRVEKVDRLKEWPAPREKGKDNK
jgi:hypothetical protein